MHFAKTSWTIQWVASCGNHFQLFFFVPSRKARKWLLVLWFFNNGRVKKAGPVKPRWRGVPFCGKQKVPFPLRVAGNLYYLDNHSFLQMDEENKLIPYMLILMGNNFPVGDLYAIWEIEISNSKIVNMLFIYSWWKFNNTLANVEKPILNVFGIYISVGH